MPNTFKYLCDTKREDQTNSPECNNNSISLVVSDPYKLLLLCSNLEGNSSKTLEVILNDYLLAETTSKAVFLIHLYWKTNEAIVRVIHKKELDIIKKVHLRPEVYNDLLECYEGCSLEKLDPNIQELLSNILGEKGGRTITVPIFCPLRNPSSSCENKNVYPAFLVCLVNSKCNVASAISLVVETFRFCAPLFVNTLKTEEEYKLKKQKQSLLIVARHLLTKLDNFKELLEDIIYQAKILIDAEKCSVFLIDEDKNELYSEVFDTSHHRAGDTVRFPKNLGVAGYVATTGKLLNIKNPYENSLFYKDVDRLTGFVTKNILCVPISNIDKVIGVAQFCNKKRGYFFNETDEEIATTFATFCGLSIKFSSAFKNRTEWQTKNKLVNELLMYHMKVKDKEVREQMFRYNSDKYPDLDKLYFNPRDVVFSETIASLIKMMNDLNLISDYHIGLEVTCRFLLYVQKNYRDVPYHNFFHAFSVAHFAYLCLKNFQLVEKGYITKLEGFAYFISCLCHDIDHRGTTNSFQQVTDSPLALLYSSVGSILERHHLSQSICILNTSDCNILHTLSSNDYKKFLNYMSDMILATDLMTHFKHMNYKKRMVQLGYKRNDPSDRYNLISLLMTCADLNDQTKRFKPVKDTAIKVMKEFFNQGDIEKSLGRTPMPMMDREISFVPSVQTGFINFVCLPVFKMLVALFPKGMPMLIRMKRNVLVWEEYGKILIKNEHDKNSLEALHIPEFEMEALSKVKAEFGEEP